MFSIAQRLNIFCLIHSTHMSYLPHSLSLSLYLFAAFKAVEVPHCFFVVVLFDAVPFSIFHRKYFIFQFYWLTIYFRRFLFRCFSLHFVLGNSWDVIDCCVVIEMISANTLAEATTYNVSWPYILSLLLEPTIPYAWIDSIEFEQAKKSTVFYTFLTRKQQTLLSYRAK